MEVIAEDEVQHLKADEKCLKDFYLAEFKVLRDEFAAVTLSLNADYRFAVTTSAAIVGFAATKDPVAIKYAVVISLIVNVGLWSKTLTQHGREGAGQNYLYHISQKLSGVIPLDMSPLNWPAALRDEAFIKQPRPPKSIVGYLDRFKGRSLNWGVLVAAPVAYLLYALF